jgi:predicted metal-dependent phosphoesterase TrpH
MGYADLHIHSFYSDGCFSPEEIVEQGKRQGLKYISITDHDTIGSQYITKNKEEDINIIPGIEFSTEYKELEIHILAYFIDIENEKLNKTVDRLKEARIDRSIEIINKLKTINIYLDINDFKSEEDYSIGRGNIAKEMVRKGYAKTFKEAFNNHLIQGKTAYVRGEKQGYKETLDTIIESGGIAVLAHPGSIYRRIEIEKTIKELKCYGLNGIEVYHPSHGKEEIISYYNLSKKYKMIVTGGSDFHGRKDGNINLGARGMTELLVEKILDFKRK